METERKVDTLSKSLPRLEVKTLVNTLTDMLKEVRVGTLGCLYNDKGGSQGACQQSKRGGLRDTEQHIYEGAGLAEFDTLTERLVVETLSKRLAEVEQGGWLTYG